MATTKIKCPVEGVIELDRLPGVSAESVRRIIDAPELQRLRAIRQLGFTERVYPGATHTRFAHSLGAFQGCQRTLAQLRLGRAEIPDEWFVATAIACLVHDLGHGPFSHTFESVVDRTHEARTLDILENGPVLPGAIEDLGPGTRGRVLQLLTDDVPIEDLRFLAHLVSSAMDCDRMDYLRRDAIFTGARYGTFDRDWLIREIAPTPDGSSLAVVEKGRSAAEQYLIGRYHMFQNVYLHKTSRGFETAFRGLCHRLIDLGSDAVPSHSTAFRALFENPLSMSTFLSLRENAFEVEIGQLVHHDDATIRALAEALHSRRPLRCVSTGSDGEELADLMEKKRAKVSKAGLDPQSAVWQDAAKDLPYQPYSPQAGSKGLRVMTDGNELVDVTAVSPTLAALAEPVVVHRLYWVA